jgi:hypothetical protein
MEDLLDRITHFSQELRALEAELQWTSLQYCAPGDQDEVLDRLLSAGLGQNLKRAVDRLNHFLWCYIESVAASPNPEVDYAQQSSRLIQITDLLRLLHHSSCPLRDSLSAVEQAAMTVTRHANVDGLQQRLSLGESV